MVCISDAAQFSNGGKNFRGGDEFDVMAVDKVEVRSVKTREGALDRAVDPWRRVIKFGGRNAANFGDEKNVGARKRFVGVLEGGCECFAYRKLVGKLLERCVTYLEFPLKGHSKETCQRHAHQPRGLCGQFWWWGA